MHIPVLLNEVIEGLNLDGKKKFLDCTLSHGGHALEILRRYPDISILGIELDPVLTQSFQEKYGDKVTVVNDNYVNLKTVCQNNNFEPDAILFDLGLSSWHYEESVRGFSFRKDEILDMRFNPTIPGPTAAEIINQYDVHELARILREYGEEQFADEVARAIITARKASPIIKSARLAEVIEAAVPEWYRHRKINSATKTFQALRIAVNTELENVQKGVVAALEVLNIGGRLAVISFHGLEDKIVKELLKSEARNGKIRIITKNVIKPKWSETQENPRSRSAKMRIVEKIV